jgi:hypothetical protein
MLPNNYSVSRQSATPLCGVGATKHAREVATKTAEVRS